MVEVIVYLVDDGGQVTITPYPLIKDLTIMNHSKTAVSYNWAKIETSEASIEPASYIDPLT